MRKITFYCDRCGKLIEQEVHQIGARFLDSEGLEMDHEYGAELCPACFREIDDMVAFMVKNPTIHFDGGKQIGAEPENQKPKKNTGHGKLNLDLGKIGALYRTNKWSIKDIASDMHCSEQTIRNHLQEALDYYDNKCLKGYLEEALENDLQEA